MAVAAELDWEAHWSPGPAALADAFSRLGADDVLPLLEQEGLSVRGTPHSFDSVENRVFRCDLGTGDQVVLKLYRPHRWSLDGLREEQRFIQDLLAEGLPVVRPVRLGADGGVGTWQGIHYTLFECVRADASASQSGVRDEGALRELGRLAARIHAVGRRRAPTNRMRLEPRVMGAGNLAFIEQGGLVPPDLLDTYAGMARSAIARAVAVLDGHPCVRLHGDFGVHNLIPGVGGPVVADFDDFMVGPPAFDLCWLHVGLRTPWGDPDADLCARDRTARALVAGYREVLPLAGDHLETMDALRVLRMVWNDAWKRARLHDATFRRARRVIEERQFWLTRLRALRALADRLGAG